MAERVGQLLGNYQVLRLLGRGAFAEVYLKAPPPITLAAPLPAPSARASNLTVGATQPLLGTQEGTGNEHEPVPLQTPRPAAHSHPAPKHARPSVAQTNRERLLRKVRAFWITGVLEHSLHGAALIALELAQQPEAVAHPWQLVLHHPAGAPHSLPAGTHISQVYDAAEGELLILGAPGSGKTTLLLELARELLDRAQHEEQHPLPVVFNLSSWAIKQQPLADWLVEELTSTYQVPRPLGQAWVEADQILPLLDLLRGASFPDRQRQIFEHYVARMLRHRGSERHYTPEQTTHWLSWLARQMKQQNQTVFYLEHLQPTWLSGERTRQAYDRWAVRFPAILMGMLVSVISSPVGVFFFLVLDIGQGEMKLCEGK